jgi:RimJ/RimL family protein N-acetyltransferase
MEYAYLVGDSHGVGAEVVHVVEGMILPALDEAGLDFVTIFPYHVSPAEVQSWFPERQPVSFGVNSFAFDRDDFEGLRHRAEPLPAGYERVRLDRHTLDQGAFQGVREDVLFCWESLERFDELGLGYGIQNSRGELVSSCYAIGYGAEAYHINVWTRPDQRRKGLAKNAVIAFLDESLQKGRPIYWINDAPNAASRRLAESVGLSYVGDLATVDIPVRPHRFHLGLAQHFADYLELYREAGELYDMAFAIRAGDSDAYLQASLVWQRAGNPAKAERYQKKADAEE